MVIEYQIAKCHVLLRRRLQKRQRIGRPPLPPAPRGRQTTSSRRAHPRPHLDPDHQALLARITSPTTLHVTAHYKPSERLPLNIGLRISYVPFIAEHDQTPTPFKRTYPAGPTQSSMNHMMTLSPCGCTSHSRMNLHPTFTRCECLLSGGFEKNSFHPGRHRGSEKEDGGHGNDDPFDQEQANEQRWC